MSCEEEDLSRNNKEYENQDCIRDGPPGTPRTPQGCHLLGDRGEACWLRLLCGRPRCVSWPPVAPRWPSRNGTLEEPLRGTKLHQGTVNHTVGATLPLTCIVSGVFSRAADRLWCFPVCCRAEKKENHTPTAGMVGLLTCPVPLRISGTALQEINLRTFSFCCCTEKK